MHSKFLKRLAVSALVSLSAAGHADPIFQGRLADGSPSSTCTVSGPGKCTAYYDSNLDITILNNWSIGSGPWSATAAPGSAQALAAAAGLAATGLTGWVLPSAGSESPFFFIWADVGGTTAGLQAQFDGVLSDRYWTSFGGGNRATFFNTATGSLVGPAATSVSHHVVAIRDGDLPFTATSVPEPQSVLLVLTAVAAGMVTSRRRAMTRR